MSECVRQVAAERAESAAAIAERAATRFGVLRSLCYPDTPATSYQHVPEVFAGRTRTHAKTDGRKLTKVHAGKFRKFDMETEFVTLLHEVTHANDGSSFGRGCSSHAPSFWEEFQRNFTRIADSRERRSVVESVFSDVLVEFDWHRAKYRAVQNVFQVDKRSETRDERKEKLADAIGYDAYGDFEYEIGVARGRNDQHVPCDPVQVNIFGPTQRFADDYSDEELLAFVEEQGGWGPSALVFVDTDEYRGDGPQIVRDEAAWEVASFDREASRKALALQERIGQGYLGLAADVLYMADDKGAYSDALPVAVDDLPSVTLVAHQSESAF